MKLTRALGLSVITAAVLVSGCTSTVVEGRATDDGKGCKISRVTMQCYDPSMPGFPTTSPTAAPQSRRAPTETAELIEYTPSPVNSLIFRIGSDADTFWYDTLGSAYDRPGRYIALPTPITGDSCWLDTLSAKACKDDVIWVVSKMESLQRSAGDLGVAFIIGHEVGHHVQASRDWDDYSELGADCLAGVYMSSLIAGQSETFETPQPDDVTSAAQRAMGRTSARDGRTIEDQMTAFELGLNGGTEATCRAAFDK